MTRYLYVFVDESGNPSSGEFYVVAGAWCVSERSNADQTLQSTVDALTAVANANRDHSTTISELKGSQLPTAVLHQLVESLDSGPAYDDPSVKQQRLPWSGSRPVRFTIHDLHPDLGIGILEETLGSSDLAAGSSLPEALQSIALATILNPLFQPAAIDLEYVDRVKVVLDAQVWQGPSDRIDAGLDVVESAPGDVRFETRDSKRTPGLQIADLAAYTWGRQLRAGDCGSGVARLENLRLADE